MKKTLIITLAAIAALVSCQKEELQQKNAEEGIKVNFCADCTKLSIGDLSGAAYHTTWNSGDSLSVVLASDNTFIATAHLDSGEGTSVGSFWAVIDPLTYSAGTQIKLVAGPSTIKAEQTAATAGNNKLENIAKAESNTVSLNYESKMNFTLSYPTAIVKVDVSSADFAGLGLQKVMVYSKGATVSDEGDYAQVTFSDPAALSEARTAWLGTLPIAEATDFYVVATLYGNYKGTEGTTVTIPVKFSGKTLKAGQVNHIKLENLTLASNSCPDWYEPVETRYLAGGWAYGDANTHYALLPEYKAGANVLIDVNVKARGAFNRVEKPLTAKTIWGYMNGENNQTRVNKSGASIYEIVDCNAVPVQGYLENNCGLGQWAIYGADGTTIIWTFNLWLVSDMPADVALDNGTIMDRNLGASFTRESKADWKCNGAYFQWGRFSFNSWGSTSYVGQDSDVYDMAQAIQAAPKIILKGTDDWKHDWYLKEHKNDLWGATSKGETAVGTKSVYDPCPKGYKVMSRPIMEELCSAIASGTATIVKTSPYYIKYKDASFPFAAGFQTNATRGSANTNRFAWYWVDSAYSNTEGACMYFDLNDLTKVQSGEKVIQKNRPRSCAYSVRCMKDDANR